jgi:hypothetical protein
MAATSSLAISSSVAYTILADRAADPQPTRSSYKFWGKKF